MTFHRAIFISFAIHALVCGGALAFAQYGCIAGLRSDTIMVSLVGPGMASGDRVQEKEASATQESEEQPVSVMDPEQFRGSDPVADSVVVASVKNDAPDAEPGDQKDGGKPGSQFGILTPNQWQLIQTALERAKNYPRMARERGIEGVVHVRFKILPSGDVERVEILKSSGHEILDSATVKTVYRSRPLPHVAGWVEVPIAYVLK